MEKQLVLESCRSEAFLCVQGHQGVLARLQIVQLAANYPGNILGELR
jgi:hypothetical protein